MLVLVMVSFPDIKLNGQQDWFFLEALGGETTSLPCTASNNGPFIHLQISASAITLPSPPNRIPTSLPPSY